MVVMIIITHLIDGINGGQVRSSVTICSHRLSFVIHVLQVQQF